MLEKVKMEMSCWQKLMHDCVLLLLVGCDKVSMLALVGLLQPSLIRVKLFFVVLLHIVVGSSSFKNIHCISVLALSVFIAIYTYAIYNIFSN